MIPQEITQDEIGEAFDGEAPDYGKRFGQHPSALIMREQTYQTFCHYVPQGQRVLDLCCGPGIDFPFWLSRRAELTGVDISKGMLAHARQAFPQVRLIRMDVAHLDQLQDRFQVIAGNFGGLNLVSDLPALARRCAAILEPEGLFFANIMSRLPLPELLEGMLRGRHFFRRLRGGGTATLTVGGKQLLTYYHHPGSFYRQMRAHFTLEAVIGLGWLLPPPYLRPIQIPAVVATLNNLPAHCFPFNRLGDHALLVMRKRGR